MLATSLICALVLSVFFFALSPGVLLTLPPNKNCDVVMQLHKGGGCSTSYEAALVHSVVFFVVAFLVLYMGCSMLKK